MLANFPTREFGRQGRLERGGGDESDDMGMCLKRFTASGASQSANVTGCFVLNGKRPEISWSVFRLWK